MKFIGKYTQEFKRILTASAVSGQNMVTISEPGWGKTEMALQTAKDIYGSDHTVFVEIDPSTPPEVIRGAYDPAAMLQGQLARRLEATPYDPDAKVVVLDELWRGNDILFDALIHATSMKDRLPVDRPVFWATSNFVGKADRTAALRDRFAIWYWMEPELDARAVAAAHLSNGTGYDASWKTDLPDFQTVDDIRRAQPGERAKEAILDIIETLTGEALAQGLVVNPRRIQQWSALVFGYGMYISGSDDFVTVPSEASQMLRYCYPATDRAAAAKWTEVAISIVDQIGAFIESYRAEIYSKFQAVSKAKSAEDRTELLGELGGVIADAERTLKEKGGSDPRVREMQSEMMVWLSNAVQGKPF